MNIYLDSIGCRLNQGEIEKIGEQFRSAGHTLVDSPANADMVVINTCTVTSAAASDSRQKARQAIRAGGREVILTGCWATMEPEQAAALPGVSHIYSNDEKDNLVADLLHLPQERFDLEPLARQPLPGLRARTRAFIKAQDGCDNFCTFCITRMARGKGRSRTVNQVLEDVRNARLGGVNEVVLSGVHLASWGQDFEQPLHLRHLIEAVLSETDVPRLRLSSLEAWDLDKAFFDLWQEARLCRHLHIPLQSGSASVLRRMGRRISPAEFAGVVEQARAVSPDMAITTDIMAGFPSETEEEFAESLRFVDQMQFAGGHVFAFSARPGTPAASLPNPVPPQVRKERSARLRAALSEASARYQGGFLGKQMTVLWEAVDGLGAEGWSLQGLTDNYLRVTARSPQALCNMFSTVLLERVDGPSIHGSIQV